jgi:hypothetical protein
VKNTSTNILNSRRLSVVNDRVNGIFSLFFYGFTWEVQGQSIMGTAAADGCREPSRWGIVSALRASILA